MDAFSHVSNTQRENANTIFKIEKLDNLGELLDTVKNLTINDAEYYESNTATAVTHKAILQEIHKYLLTLATETFNKNY